MEERKTGLFQADRRYKAFISYRHLPLDKEVAEKLQKSIEHYTVPAEFREKAGGKKLGLVFRDEDELPLSSDLSNSITYALDHSEFLIVVCTPDLPKSRWCEQEIRHFLETHDRDHVLAVLADGTPEESFSPLLLHTFDVNGNILTDIEPLAANLAGRDHTINRKAFQKEMTRIRAALLGEPFDALWQREKRSRLIRLATVMTAVMVSLTVFLAVALNQNRLIRQKNVEISEQKDQIQSNLNEITEKNEQIREQNEEITKKNSALERQLSSMLVDAGNTLLGEFDVRGALQNALEAVESNDPAIYDHRAERLLMNALGAYYINSMRGELIYEQTTDIVDLRSDQSGERAYLADLIGNISCVDQESGKLLWKAPSVIDAEYEGEFPVRLFLSEENGLLICKNYGNIAALSLSDGTPVWNYVYRNGNTFFAVSDDAATVAVFDRDTWREGFDPAKELASVKDLNTQTELIFLNTSDGSEKGRRKLTEDSGFSVNYGAGSFYGASFSETGRLFACAFAYQNEDDPSAGHYEYFLINTDNMEQIRREATDYSLSAVDLFYGIAIDESTGSMLAAQYNSSYGGITVTVFHGDGTVTGDLYEQTVGSVQKDLSEVRRQPMLLSRHHAVICSADSVYILDRSDGTLAKSFRLDSDILDAGWLDRNEEAFTLITAGGTVALYDLAHGSGSWLDSYTQYTLAQSDNSEARCVHGGFFTTQKSAGFAVVPNGGYLTVPGDNPGRLIRVRSLSDPHALRTDLPKDINTSRIYLCSSPSGNRVFCLTGGSGEWVLRAYEATDGKLVAENRFPYDSTFSNVQQIEALDEERVLGQCVIFPLEGEAKPIIALKDYYTSFYNAKMVRSCRLYTGQLMTVVDLTGFYKIHTPYDYVALDGNTVSSINDLENRMIFQDRSVFEIGPNGFELGYGVYRQFDEAQNLITSEEPAFVLFDALGEERIVIPDASPGAGGKKVSLGTKEKIFVCGDEQGCLWLYDIPTGQARLVSDAFSRGEIMDVAMVPGDRQVAVFSRTGRLEILDLEDGKPLCALTFSSLLTGITDYSCECELDEKTGRLYLFVTSRPGERGYLSRVDTGSWTTDFSFGSSRYYPWSRADDRVYTYSGGLFSFPAYHLEDLISWAKEAGPES